MNALMHTLRSLFRRLPAPVRTRLLSVYHLTLAQVGAMIYRYPSHGLCVIAVTGTKGKTTVTEILNAIFEAAGHPTVLSNTIRFKAVSDSRRNLRKMTMPGRFFLQSLLRRGRSLGATHAIIEMTSEGAAQHRHRGIALNALVFTNLAPEHIESHGSLEAYGNAKLEIARTLEHSHKRPRIIVAPEDDVWGRRFLERAVDVRLSFMIEDARPYGRSHDGVYLTVQGVRYESKLPGEANIKNMLACILLARQYGISPEAIQTGLNSLASIPGRFENVNEGGAFPVIVDYAHTPESLEELYKTFEGKRRICVLGATGGGRDTWKRRTLGTIADGYCDEIFLTDEDPYDEDPVQIIEDVRAGVKHHQAHIIVDRKEAIQKAVKIAHEGDAVLISGKGTDPYLMGPRGSKTPWCDADIARDALPR